MLKLYKQTRLEGIIEGLYHEKGILSPVDLDIEIVAERFNIKLRYMEDAPDRALWTEKKALIFLNPHHSKELLREIFFHELCHPLGHYGSQSNMNNDAFIQLQEAQAGYFQLYAALPFFMIQELDLSNYEPKMIAQLSDTFNVTSNLVVKRMEQIKRRIYQAKSDEESRLFMESRFPKAPPYSDQTNSVLNRLKILLEKKGVTQ